MRVNVGLGALPSMSASGALSSGHDLDQNTLKSVFCPFSIMDRLSPCFSSLSRVNTAVRDMAVSTCPDSTALPGVPGTALKLYQPTSEPLSGTCIRPSGSTPSVTIGASTPTEGMTMRMLAGAGRPGSTATPAADGGAAAGLAVALAGAEALGASGALAAGEAAALIAGLSAGGGAICTRSEESPLQAANSRPTATRPALRAQIARILQRPLDVVLGLWIGRDPAVLLHRVGTRVVGRKRCRDVVLEAAQHVLQIAHAGFSVAGRIPGARRGLAAQKRSGVNTVALVADFVVHVGAGGVARAAYQANDVARLHHGARLYTCRLAAGVAVEHVPGTVTDHHQVAKALRIGADLHGPADRGANRRALRRGQVDARVEMAVMLAIPVQGRFEREGS